MGRDPGPRHPGRARYLPQRPSPTRAISTASAAGPERPPLRERSNLHEEPWRPSLQPLDRVHTYAGFHIADLAVPA